MEKILAFLLSLLLLSAPALAAEDLTALSDDELTALRDRISLELAARSAHDGVLASWDTELAHIDLLSIRRGLTDDGAPGVRLLFAYTNTGADVDNFRAHHWVTLYHDGVERDRVIRLDGDLVGTDSWGAKVMPGRTLQTMEWFFLLPGTEDTVVVEIEDRCDRVPKSAGLRTVQLPAE